ncbi:MAG: hypothetical protein H0T13_09500 [Actinobacteria bacterium]|nr:hypothetical protein [Actinomycetota bacterium]
MTEHEHAGRAEDQETSQPDEDDSVPNGEEDIDEAGRNATQQRMAEQGEPPVT